MAADGRRGNRSWLRGSLLFRGGEKCGRREFPARRQDLQSHPQEVDCCGFVPKFLSFGSLLSLRVSENQPKIKQSFCSALGKREISSLMH